MTGGAPRSWWTPEGFAADVPRADDARLREMHRWAAERGREADAPGTGRSKKARAMFNAMTRVAAAELERRGLSY